MRTAYRCPLHILWLLGLFAGVENQTAQAQVSRYNELANLPLVENRQTPKTAKILSDELLFQRATLKFTTAVLPR